jgi:hypothetical protein
VPIGGIIFLSDRVLKPTLTVAPMRSRAVAVAGVAA